MRLQSIPVIGFDYYLNRYWGFVRMGTKVIPQRITEKHKVAQRKIEKYFFNNDLL